MEKKQYICFVCNLHCKRNANLKKHIETHNEIVTKLVCPLCAEVNNSALCSGMNNLIVHVKRKHSRAKKKFDKIKTRNEIRKIRFNKKTKQIIESDCEYFFLFN